MLYIFQVDTGTMLTFDMTLAMDSVTELQRAIARVYRIPPDKQVLLISGGENLDPKATVGSYHAGTDTNPIFLFSKQSIESASAPSASVSYGLDVNLQDQVEGSLNMPNSYETVVARTQLAIQIQDVATAELKACERIVHDQHLQHQGWAAVIANLEDITSAFTSRTRMFETNYEEYLASRNFYIEILTQFPDTIKLLGKIPLLPCLSNDSIHLTMRSTNSSADSNTSATALARRGASFDSDASSLSRPKSLLEWISAQDSRNTLEEMAKNCLVSLQQFDGHTQQSLLHEVNEVIRALDNQDMKQVKGLEDRLGSLERIIHSARNMVQEQKDMAQGFLQNQTRARNLKDQSVLPDLCSSHKRQLLVMLQNQNKLKKIKKQCASTKEELAYNLHTRLRWVMYVEKMICDVDSKLVIHHETLKKLKRKLEIVMQMHNTPDLYATAVVEVVRRKNCTLDFLKWAESLAEDRNTAHVKEIEKREQFSEAIKHHFLQALFPGFDEMPPPFAITAPKPFDDHLPPIQPTDIEYLRDNVPELAAKLKMPDSPGLPGAVPSSLATLTGCGPGDTLTRSYDPACSDIVILENEPEPSTQEEQEQQQVVEVVEAHMEEEEEDETFHPAAEKLDSLHPLSVSEPVPMPRMALGSTSMEHPSHAPSPPFGLLPVASKDSLTIPPSQSKSTPPTVSMSKEKSGSPVGNLNLSEEMDAATSKTDKREALVSMGKSPPYGDDFTSEGFATADFYIDESMPSSMTDSNSKRVTELQQVILEKSALLDVRERELDEQRRVVEQLAPQLKQAKESFKLLHDLVEKNTLQLKCEVLSLEKQMQKEKDDFLGYAASISRTILETIERFEKEQAEKSRSEIEKLKGSHEEDRSKWEEKLELEINQQRDTQKQLESYEVKLRQREEEFENVKSESEKKFENAGREAEEELTKAKNQMVLEHELELERVKSDLAVEVEEKANEVLKFQEMVDVHKKSIQELEDRLASVHEKMQGEFDKERKSLKEKVEKEIEEKCAIFNKEHSEKVLSEHEAELDTLKLDHEKLVQSEKEKSEKLQTEEMEILRKSLTEKYENELKEVEGVWKTKVEELENKLKEMEETKCEMETELQTVQKKVKLTVTELESNLEETVVLKDRAVKEKEEISGRYKEEQEQLLQKFELEKGEILTKLENENKVKLDKSSAEKKEIVERFEQEKRELLERFAKEKKEIEEKMEEEKQKVDKDWIPSEKHGELIAQMQAAFEEKKKQEIEQALQAAQSQHDEELSRDQEKKMSSMQASLTAEKQVTFNEALNKAVADREKVIQELREQLIQHQGTIQELERVKKAKEKEFEEEQKQQKASGAKEKKKESRSLQRHLEEELSVARKEILQLQSQLHSQMGQSSMMQSVAPIADLPPHERLHELELQHPQSSILLAAQSMKRSIESMCKTSPEQRPPSLFHTSPRYENHGPYQPAASSNHHQYQYHGNSLHTSLVLLDHPDHQDTESSSSSGLGESERSSPNNGGGGMQWRMLGQVLVPDAMMDGSFAVLPDADIDEHWLLVKSKDEELTKMVEKMNELSMTRSSQVLAQDKVSITTCNRGDVVLLCLDERHDHYVVFTVGTVLHFLHSDCLDALSLRTAPGEARKSWVLAEIIEKEYCQAKKPNNRFKVPVGTKFYRVKARPWERETRGALASSVMEASTSTAPR